MVQTLLYHGFKGAARGVFQLYHGNAGFPVEYLAIPQEILWSHMTPTGQKKTIKIIYLPERRGESCESTSPVNYKEYASRPYLSYINLQTSVGLWLPWYKSVIPCLLVVYHEYTQQ